MRGDRRYGAECRFWPGGILLVRLVGWHGSGLFNGILVTWLRIPAIVATLGTLGLYRGLMLLLTGGKWIEGLPADLKSLSTPILFSISPIGWLTMLLILAMAWLLGKTAFGRSFYATGDNLQGARQLGVRTDSLRIFAFSMNGVMAALAGIVFASQIGFIPNQTGNGLEMKAIAACVLGGISLLGGTGTIIGAILGAFLLTQIDSVLVLLRLPAGGMTLLPVWCCWGCWYSMAVCVVLLSVISANRNMPASLPKPLLVIKNQPLAITTQQLAIKEGGIMNLYRRYGWELTLAALLVLEILLFGLSNSRMLDINVLLFSTSDFICIGIVALPLTMVIVSGGIDISFGSTIGLCAIFLGIVFQAGVPMSVAIPLTVLVGALCGLINAGLILYTGVNPLVITLGTLYLFGGSALLLSGLSGATGYEGIGGFPAAFTDFANQTLFGLPIPLVILCCVFCCSGC